jgi:phage baseplate assembly protein V
MSAGAAGAAVDVVGLLQALVRSELAKLRVAEVGIVEAAYSHESGSDKNNHACDVRLRDTGLVLPKVPVAVDRIGRSSLPNPGDAVLVQFLGGDLHGAVITGRFYTDQARPPEAKAKEWVFVCPDPAESGLRRIHVELPEGNVLTVEDKQLLLKCGSTSVKIKNGGSVEIKSAAAVKVQADGDVSIQAGGDLVLKAGGKLSASAGTDMKLEGLTVAAKAQTTAQLEGGAQAGVKGPMVSLAGMTNFSPS